MTGFLDVGGIGCWRPGRRRVRLRRGGRARSLHRVRGRRAVRHHVPTQVGLDLRLSFGRSPHRLHLRGCVQRGRRSALQDHGNWKGRGQHVAEAVVMDRKPPRCQYHNARCGRRRVDDHVRAQVGGAEGAGGVGSGHLWHYGDKDLRFRSGDRNRTSLVEFARLLPVFSSLIGCRDGNQKSCGRVGPPPTGVRIQGEPNQSCR